MIFTDSKYCKAKGSDSPVITLCIASIIVIIPYFLKLKAEKVDMTMPSRKSGRCQIHDLISDPYRWDQKVFVFVLLAKDEKKEDFAWNNDLNKCCNVSSSPIRHYVMYY